MITAAAMTYERSLITTSDPIGPTSGLTLSMTPCRDRCRDQFPHIARRLWRTMSAAVWPAALARFTPILVQDRAAGPSRNSAVARALRLSGLYT
jgi:hypothetical protein